MLSWKNTQPVLNTFYRTLRAHRTSSLVNQQLSSSTNRAEETEAYMRACEDEGRRLGGLAENPPQLKKRTAAATLPEMNTEQEQPSNGYSPPPLRQIILLLFSFDWNEIWNGTPALWASEVPSELYGDGLNN